MAPKGSGVGDYIGMFACTAGLGLDDVILKFKEVGDSSRSKGAECLCVTLHHTDCTTSYL